MDRPLGPGIEVLKKIVWLSIVDLTAENLGKRRKNRARRESQ